MSQQNKQKNHIKSVALLVSVLLIVCVTVGGTLAFLIDTDGPIINLFNPSKVTTEVVEDINGNIKQNVKIKNTGDTEAWIRVAVIITWQDAQGNIYGRKPVAGTDYSLILNVNDPLIDIDVAQWILGDDGFYYWPLPVKSDDEDAVNCYTGVLIESCTYEAEANAPDGYYLNVEILGSGIQSKPDRVFNTEWQSSGLKVTIVDGIRQLSPVSATQGG